MALLPDNKNPQPAQATQSASPQPKRKGTGFTNLQRILQASQGSKLGQSIAGGITGQAQQVQSGIRSAQEQFRTEAKKETDKLDAENARNVIQQAASGQEITSALPDFQRYLSGEYKGPMELANRQQLAAQAQQAETVGRLASGIGSRSGTEAGDRQQLLSRFAGGADYTSGQRKLDESILARDKDANLAAAARQTRGVAEQAQRAGAVAQQEAQQYQNLAKIFAKETREKIGEAKTPISQQLDAQVLAVESKEKQRDDFIQNLQKTLKTNEFMNLDSAGKKQRLQEVLASAGPQSLGLLTQEQIDRITGKEGIFSSQQKDIEQMTSLRNLASFVAGKVKEKGSGPFSDATYKAALNTQSEINKYIQNLQESPISQDLLDRLAASNIISQNLNRQGVASSDIIDKLNALDKLSGKQFTDLEFSPERQVYIPGKIQFSPDETKLSYLKNRAETADQQLKLLNSLMSKVKDYQKYADSWDRMDKYYNAKEALDQISSFLPKIKEYSTVSQEEYKDFLKNYQQAQDKEILK